MDRDAVRNFRGTLGGVLILISSTFDPTSCRPRTGVAGPGGAGMRAVEWRDGEWRGRWRDGLALLDVWTPVGPFPLYLELWLAIEGCAPVPIGDLRSLRSWLG